MIPTPEVASKWAHLENIKNQISPLEDAMEIGVLIGCNCSKALKPLQQVIPGRKDDPYAIKTRLGWGIIGPTNMDVSTNDIESSCLRILTQ